MRCVREVLAGRHHTRRTVLGEEQRDRLAPKDGVDRPLGPANRQLDDDHVRRAAASDSREDRDAVAAALQISDEADRRRHSQVGRFGFNAPPLQPGMPISQPSACYRSLCPPTT